MSPVPIDNGMPETTSSSGDSRRFGSLRGVQWRIDLGILPSSPSASIDDIRRVTANSRRRYATLRRQVLIDPNVQKDGSSSPDLVMDNPLSQNPDSMWGRFFRNAELERMVDQDLTRLYPERGSYFQTSGCQGMLRRILLLWCLRHPEYGYRQGMHELLAPLLYVLHVDVERLSEVRKTYDDLFADKFDGFSFHENDLTYKFDFKKFSESSENGNGHENISKKASSFQELNPEIQSIILLSDAYGAEGELGIVLSEKFMEHDTYSMFDALMSGAGGPVSMAQFFSPSPFSETSHTGFLPVIEASAALYHVLSLIDPSLHSHLIELEVEPQYFALRWLRVLFGREFSLEDLLVIWDEIFAHENAKSDRIPVDGEDADSNFGILESPRGAFICSFAVSMILNLRSSILATEIATACLQRLLNFPEDVKIVKLLEKAKSLQPVALDANSSNSLPIQPGLYDIVKKSTGARVHGHRHSHTLSLDSTSPRTPLSSTVPDSYWEEKWRVLHEEQKHKLENKLENVPTRKKGWSERVRLRLSRTESDPSPSKKSVKAKPSVRRSLLQDLAKQLGSDEDQESIMGLDEDKSCDNSSSEENSSNSSDQMTSPSHGNNSDDNENESERRSSVASNSSVDENDAESSNSECAPLPVSNIPDHDVITSECTQTDDSVGKSATGVKEKRLLSGKFQWLWKFGRNSTNEGTSACPPEEAKPCNDGSDHNNVAAEDHNDGASDTSDSSCGTTKGETTVDQNLMVSLKNLGQSMLENIQVIESVFQQDRGQTVSLENMSKNGLVGKGQVTAVAALKELRKISNLLSEM